VAGMVTSAIGGVLLRARQRFLRPSGGMLIVPNRSVGIYTRLWCCHEIYCAVYRERAHVSFARCLIPCGRVKSSEATCSEAKDAQRLRGEIEEECGFKRVDAAIRQAEGHRMVTLFYGLCTVGCSCFAYVLSAMAGVVAADLSMMTFGALISTGLFAALVSGILFDLQPGRSAGLWDRRQALRYTVHVPLALLAIGAASVAIRRWSRLLGWMGVFLLRWTISYLLVVLCHAHLRLQQSWARRGLVRWHQCSVAWHMFLVVLFVLAPRCSQSLTYAGCLLPFGDRLRRSLCLVSPVLWVLCSVLKQLVDFDVRIRLEPTTAGDRHEPSLVRGGSRVLPTPSRGLRPARGRRLIYT